MSNHKKKRRFKVGDAVRFLPEYAHQAPGVLTVLAIGWDESGDPDILVCEDHDCHHYEWAFEPADVMADGADEYKEIMKLQRLMKRKKIGV